MRVFELNLDLVAAKQVVINARDYFLILRMFTYNFLFMGWWSKGSRLEIKVINRISIIQGVC